MNITGNRRSTPNLVWIPNNKENLVINAFRISVTRNSICVDAIRKGKIYVRKYESFAALCDDLHIRNVVD